MNCHEFERSWAVLLDALTPDHNSSAPGPNTAGELAELERAVLGHAQTCATCRTAHARYQTLHEALCHWLLRPRPSSVPSPQLIEHILAVTSRSPWRRASWRIAVEMVTGLAASVLILLLVRSVSEPGRPEKGAIRPGAVATSGPGLSQALADATAATLDLAWTTSEPAARLGWEVLAAGTKDGGGTAVVDPDEPHADGLISLTSVLRGVPQPLDGSLLQDVGDGLSASVRPLSSSALKAIEFLRTPAPEKHDRSTRPPASKGA